MKHTKLPQSLSDDELLHQLAELVQDSRRVEADLVAHIGEVDERRLYVSRACSSMFAYCTEILHLSEGESYLRIAAARASRRHPQLLEMLSDGRMHLSGVGKLAAHLTNANCKDVLGRATYKSKREIEELVAELVPKPDAPPTVRRLPARVEPTPSVQLRPDAVKNETPPRPVPPPPAPVVQPLAPERYKVTFTASTEFRDKLDRLQALMDGDLATVIEAAVTEKLARLEAKRYAKTKVPRKNLDETLSSASSRYIPAAVRRLVCKRDGDQCTFVDATGRRCTEHRSLEFHHDDPFGRGGDHHPTKVWLLCRVHNLLVAERDYGKEAMKKYQRNGRASEPRSVYGEA